MLGLPSSLRLAPGETRTLRFEVKERNDAVVGNDDSESLELNLRQVSKILARAGERFCFIKPSQPMHPSKTPLALDGWGKDWEDAPAREANSAKDLALGKLQAAMPDESYPLWLGPEDLSFKVKTLRDGSGIDFLIDVVDGMDKPETCPAQFSVTSMPWNYGCVSVYIKKASRRRTKRDGHSRRSRRLPDPCPSAGDATDSDYGVLPPPATCPSWPSDTTCPRTTRLWTATAKARSIRFSTGCRLSAMWSEKRAWRFDTPTSV